MFTTPILLISFNRPDLTLKILKTIKKVKSDKLYFAVDGPRPGNEEDKINCKKTRQLIKFIDWKCDIKTLFQKNNLGCGLGPIAAINWFFKNVNEGIILEDDCLPNLDFFRFCSELLKYYQHTEKVMHISGDNFQYGIKRGNYSYYFSQYTHSWGWATWRRAWKYNDYYCIPEAERKDVWDRQWMISVKKTNGLAILPNVNLVSNIGFGKNATHTKTIAAYTNLPQERLSFPLSHPIEIKFDKLADSYTARNHFGYTPTYYYFYLLEAIANRVVGYGKFIVTNIDKLIQNIYLRFMRVFNNLKFIRLYDMFKNYTMIPKNVFIGNLELVQQFRTVGGCVVECGVWKGGMISAMAKLLGNKRKYYLFDSFEGLPPATKIDGESALRWQKDKNSPLYFNNCRTEENCAREAMALSGAKNYKIIRGWFSKTLLNVKFNHNIAVLRLDADWYEPTMECLEALYDHVVSGGIIIIDDYYTWDGCAKAVHKFITVKEDAPRLCQSQKGVCYVLKH